MGPGYQTSTFKEQAAIVGTMPSYRQPSTPTHPFRWVWTTTKNLAQRLASRWQHRPRRTHQQPLAACC